MFQGWHIDRKSTRLNSSHRCISYAVFCLKKKNKIMPPLYIHRYDILRYATTTPTPTTRGGYGILPFNSTHRRLALLYFFFFFFFKKRAPPEFPPFPPPPPSPI